MSEHVLSRVIVGIAFVCLLAAGITVLYGNDDSEIRALESQGFTEIQIGSWSPLSCSDSDTSSKSFKAKNFQGRNVEGVVCCGILEGCTVRW